jgi:hypothetical protein
MKEMGMVIVPCGEKYLVVWLHTSVDPPMDLWNEAMDRIGQVVTEKLQGDLSKFVVLAISDGGAPNSVQRNHSLKVMGTSKTAGLSTQLSKSRIIRGVTTAMSWINPNFKAFMPEQFDLALDHLGMIPFKDRIVAALVALQKNVAPVETLALSLGQKV